MPQSNVEIVRAVFHAYFRGDMESVLRLTDPEVVVMQPSEVPDATTRHGHAGVMEAIAVWPEQWDDYELEIVQIVDAGGHVVVRTHQRGRGKASGVEVEDEIWFVFGFRNGKVAEWRMFGAEREALEAAGLQVSSVVHRGNGARPEVAMTYDDGPGSSTRAVMDLLASHDARATFFMVGSEVERDPALAREVVSGGHEVGSHSMHHLDHEQVDAGEAVADMVAGAEAIKAVLGFEPRLYRAPYGHFVPATVAEAEERGWICVHWSALGNDWEDDATSRSVADRIVPGLAAGVIVLLHDSRRAKPMNPEPVIGATAILLEELARRELRARAVTDILS
jgi:peptidoglycan-N-acetylglucosamine deacetylase